MVVGSTNSSGTTLNIAAKHTTARMQEVERDAGRFTRLLLRIAKGPGLLEINPSIARAEIVHLVFKIYSEQWVLIFRIFELLEMVMQGAYHIHHHIEFAIQEYRFSDTQVLVYLRF